MKNDVGMRWEMVKLGDIVKMVTGKTPPTSNLDYFDGDYMWVNPSDFGAKYIVVSKRTVTQKAIDEKKCNLLPKDSILLSCIGDIGKIGILKTQGASNQQITGLITHENVLPDYLFYYLLNNKSKLESLANKAVVSILNNERLRELEVSLPPLHIQKRIAEILDAADALKRKDQELLKKYDELAQAIFIDMFGDPVKNEKGWEVKTIEQLVKKTRYSLKRGPFGGALKKEIFVSDGYLVYEQFHALNNDFTFGRYYINQEKYDELITFDVKPKDIIISCSAIYLGKLAIVPEGAKPGIINQALLKLTLDENIYKNEFFVKVFTQENFKETYFASERGAAIPNFPPMATFKEFKFICPPIKIQNEYLNLVQNLQNQTDIVSTEQKTTDNLFQALIQKAFKGELVAE